ncbi:MAG: efflux RND transporter periplasmic adaptor subunit [Cyclobacteriaceae bacterium]|nr:efflux RND transporter periplasmic adaptor subunit [Cyclobacteriaceae bacterium]
MANKKSNKLLYIIGGAIGLLIVFIIIGKSTGLLDNRNQTEVTVAQASLGDITETVSASGTVQPEVEVKISPDVPGEIIELNVEEGDSVRVRDLLIKIRPDNFQSALERSMANLNQQRANQASSQARLSQADAEFIRAQKDFDRNKNLYQEKVISDAEYEAAEASYQVAKQELESARQGAQAARYTVASSQASVDEAQENLSLTSVFAPMNGIVSKLSVEKGERVVGTSQMAGTEMLRIADLNRMEVRVDVNENDIIRVSVGDTATIDVDAYSYTGKKFFGTVTQIANTAKDKISDDAVTEFEVRVRILNESYADLLEEKASSPFRPGMTASVDIITTKKKDILMVPLSAVTTREREDDQEKEASTRPDDAAEEEQKEVDEVVFISEEGEAKMVVVKTGISDFDNIEILEGIAEGVDVITGPFMVVSKRLEDGDAVKQDNSRKDDSDE